MASYAMLTNVGRNKEAAALANGISLVITEMAWGDGDRIPNGAEVALDNEVGRKQLQGQGLTQGATDTAFFEVLLTENEGPFVIREAGLFDDDGDLIAIARYDPAVNKPLNTVSAVLRINVLFSDLENLVLQVNSSALFAPENRTLTAGTGLAGGGDLSQDRAFSVVFATEAEALAGLRPDATMSPKTTKALVDAVIAALTNGAPGALDTLKELADALGDNDDDIAALMAAVGGYKDFGLGKTTLNTTHNLDMNTEALASGFYSGTGWTDTPYGDVVGAWSVAQIEVLGSAGSNYRRQTWYYGSSSTFAKETWVRTKVNGVWSVWARNVTSSEYNAADVLAKVKTVDGTGSGLDADKLDGQHLDFFQPALEDTSKIELGSSRPPEHRFIDLHSEGGVNDYDLRLVRFKGAAGDAVLDQTGGGNLRLDGGANLLRDGFEIWHAGNDGAGSGLDADKLDGLEGSHYKKAMPTAWANINGTGAGSIRESFNVASLTDLGTGLYRLTFASPMVDTNFAFIPYVGHLATAGDERSFVYYNAKTTTHIDFETRNTLGGLVEWDDVSVVILGGK